MINPTADRPRLFGLLLFAGLSVFCIACRATGDNAADAVHPPAAVVPPWVFPLNSPATGAAPIEPAEPLRVRGSQASYTAAELGDLFSAPDWFPATHSPMPTIVASGRKPSVFACGYCHTPSGQGRPENASLAGLPAAYIMQQAAAFRSGARRSASPYAFAPVDFMIATIAQATPEEISAAARYFSAQHPIERVRVVETDRVPRSRVVGFVFAPLPEGGDEPLGQRILEFAPDPARHEARDDRLRYVAYAPRGSIARGRTMARGANGLTIACISCHGERLQGVDLVPPIAGRSPSYLLRQLLAFQKGARSGVTAQPMLPIVARLQMANMIDVVAYAASLKP